MSGIIKKIAPLPAGRQAGLTVASQLIQIFQKYRCFLEKIPDIPRDQVLLAGGAAACLLGSDRPLSNDLDFLAAPSLQKTLKKALNTPFSVNTHKTIFHSLTAHLTLDGTSFDVTVRSVIEPLGSTARFEFQATPEILKRRLEIPVDDGTIFCVPAELLILMKLLAGRGKEFGKYDLYDVSCILKHRSEIDRDFFTHLLDAFGKNREEAVRIITKHLKQLQSEYGDSSALEVLTSIIFAK